MSGKFRIVFKKCSINVLLNTQKELKHGGVNKSMSYMRFSHVNVLPHDILQIKSTYQQSHNF